MTHALNYQTPQVINPAQPMPFWRWFIGAISSFALSTFFGIVGQRGEMVELITGLFLCLYIFCAPIAFVRSLANRRCECTLLVILPIVLIFLYVGQKSSARTAQAQTTKALCDIRSLESAVESFKIDTGEYPTNVQGIKILAENTSNLDGWQGPYLLYCKDPWGNDYVYQIPGAHNPNGYDLISLGSDGKLNTADDLHN